MSTRPGPDQLTIGGRLKLERQRLKLSQVELAQTIGVARRTVCAWEAAGASILAEPLSKFADAGADVLFIVTGRREAPARSACPAPQNQIGNIIRPALAMLCSDSRKQLLALLSDELRG